MLRTFTCMISFNHHNNPLKWVTQGEGNGNPLQYSCLENPMDGGAWCSARRIPGLAEPGGLPSMGSHRVGHD